MSGLSLLAPLGLIALISVPLVVLFHMRNTTPVVLTVPSLRFWRLAIHEESNEERFKKPPINLLFLLHLLLVALIAFALTRPAASRALGGFGARTEPEHVILLLDGSTSMSATDTPNQVTRFEAARSQALDRLGELRDGDVATVILIGTHSSTFEATDATGLRGLRERLQSTSQPGGRADFNEALALTRDLLLPSMNDSIVMITDGAISVDPTLVQDIAAPIELVRVGADHSPNVAITSIATRGSQSNPGEQLLFARIANFGIEEVTVPVVIDVDGIELSRGDVTIPPDGGAEEITQSLPAGSSTVTVRVLSSDVLSIDDVASSALIQGEQFGLRILLVSDVPTALRRALSVLPGAQITMLSPVEAEAATDLSTYDLIVYEHALPSTNFPNTPVLVVAPPEGGILPTRGVMANPTVQRVQPQDSLLIGVELAGVTFGQAPVHVLDGTQAEVVGAEVGPLLYRARTSTGHAMIVMTFDIAESNLPQRVAFPILIANIANELAPSPLPSAAPLGEPLSYRPASDATTVRIVPPAGEAVDLVVTSDSATVNASSSVPGGASPSTVSFPDTGVPGEYLVIELDAEGSQLGGGRLFINGGHLRESDLATDPSLPEVLSMATTSSDVGVGRSLADLWPAIAVAVLGLLLFEWVVTLAPRRRARAGRATVTATG